MMLARHALVLSLPMALAHVVVAHREPAPSCLMAPPAVTLQMPRAGLSWLPGEDSEGPCEAVPPERWIRKRWKTLDLLVDADGPGGSGRYWTITIGLADRGATQPSRGVCLTTSTAGWPILMSFRNAALPWLEDRDGDGHAEAIVWLSFGLTEEMVQSRSGLMAWVYKMDRAGVLKVDLSLSRGMAREIASAYRQAPPAGGEQAAASLAPYRRIAAAALDTFAGGRCDVSLTR